VLASPDVAAVPLHAASSNAIEVAAAVFTITLSAMLTCPSVLVVSSTDDGTQTIE
jgi:hypothetical protein